MHQISSSPDNWAKCPPTTPPQLEAERLTWCPICSRGRCPGWHRDWPRIPETDRNWSLDKQSLVSSQEVLRTLTSTYSVQPSPGESDTSLQSKSFLRWEFLLCYRRIFTSLTSKWTESGAWSGAVRSRRPQPCWSAGGTPWGTAGSRQWPGGRTSAGSSPRPPPRSWRAWSGGRPWDCPGWSAPSWADHWRLALPELERRRAGEPGRGVYCSLTDRSGAGDYTDSERQVK